MIKKLFFASILLATVSAALENENNSYGRSYVHSNHTKTDGLPPLDAEFIEELWPMGKSWREKNNEINPAYLFNPDYLYPKTSISFSYTDPLDGIALSIELGPEEELSRMLTKLTKIPVSMVPPVEKLPPQATNNH